MDFRSIFYSCLTVFLIDFSCDTHVEIPVSVKVPIDYTALENELLRDSALAGREELIRSVVEFYRMEIPNQFSRRISLGNGRTDKVFLDEMVDKQIDSLRETLKPTTRIAFQNIVDSQIVDTVYLIDNIRSALSSADKYPWNRSIPDSIFLNYLQIPQMTGDHWFDATRDYMAVSNIDIPVSENITKKIDLGYIPGTLDFGRFLRGKMAHIFITKPRQN